jgi:RNA polymerase sigma-70 factor (ECF subfamily)
VPIGAALLPNLDAVLQAIYLLFNEGYKSNTENAIIRRDLCDDALRLCSLLARHPATNLPKTHALLSLICFQASRFDARLDANGHIILLEYQDRKHWNQALITLAYQHLKIASSGKEISEYHLEAAIASYHASAQDFGQTNWKGIFFCYDLLYKINTTPFVALNRAIALGYAEGSKAGIAALLNISELQKNHLWFMALGDFYQKNKENKAAEAAFRSALDLVQLPVERTVIQQKIQTILSRAWDE